MNNSMSRQVPLKPERFSRTLGEASPYVRSSQTHIVPMDTPPLTHPADRIVGWGCAFGGVAVAAFLIAEKAGLL